MPTVVCISTFMSRKIEHGKSFITLGPGQCTHSPFKAFLWFIGTFGFKRNEELAGNIVTTTRSHSDFTITKTVEACEPSEVLRVGGAGHKVNSPAGT